MNHLKTVILGFLVAGIASCNTCQNVLPAPNYFLFSLIDTSGADLFESTYNEAAYPRIKDRAVLQFTSTTDGSRGYYFSDPSFTSGGTYYLELSPTDSDTLSITYAVAEEKCYTDYTFLQFTYNGSNHLLSTTNEMVIVK